MDLYFNSLASLFPRVTPKQREGIIILTNATRTLPLEQRAYLLATAYHETAFTMQPIVEFGGRKYFDKYDTGRLAEALGNTPEADLIEQHHQYMSKIRTQSAYTYVTITLHVCTCPSKRYKYLFVCLFVCWFLNGTSAQKGH